MIRVTALQYVLSGLVGLRPHYAPNLPQYAPDLLNSRSGIYLNDIHPLITPENLIAALPKYPVSSYPAWDNATQYGRGDIRRVNSQLYISTQPSKNLPPATNPAAWLPTDIVSAKLRQLLDAAVAQMAAAVVQQKIADGGRTVLNQTQLYHGSGSIINRIIKKGRFCGLEIEAKAGRDLAVRLMRVGLQVDTPNPALKLYLYHSSQAQPICIFEPQFKGSGTFSWAQLIDASMTLTTEAYAAGGVFLFGYYEDDLQGQIIDREKDWLNPDVVLCGTCNPYDTAAFQQWNEYLTLHPFSIAEEYLNEDRTLFDLERINYNYFTNWGINLDVAVECDVTQFIYNNENSVADALGKQAAVNVLQVFANTTENNQLAEKCRQAALYQLDNRENYSPGLVKDVKAAYAAIAFNVSEEGSPCVPASPAIGYSVSNATV